MTAPRPATPAAKSHRWFAAFYRRFNDFVEKRWLAKVRADMLADVTGDVLEIGAGTGANLPHYRRAERVVLTEPDAAMRRYLAERLNRCPAPVEVVAAPAEELPFPDHSFDAVVCTLVLCSVDDPARAIAEMRRVLRPDGRLVFLEHVAGQGRRLRRQERLDPVWNRLFAGCHLTRDTVQSLKDAGFAVEELRTLDMTPKVDPSAPLVLGTARPEASANTPPSA